MREINPTDIYERTIELTTRLKAGLSQITGVTLHTPIARERSAALVSFELAGWSGPALAAALQKEHRIITRALFQEHQGIRASLSFFTREEELDILLTAIRAYAKRGNR